MQARKNEKEGKKSSLEPTDEKSPLPKTLSEQKILKSRFTRFKLAMAPRIRSLRFDMYLMSRSLTSIVGLVLLSILIFLVAFPWLFAQPNFPDPYEMHFDLDYRLPQPPGTAGFVLGSGTNGADYYYGLIWGARVSMEFAIEVVGASILIGTVLGLISGFKGGAVDEIIMRVTDVFLSIPSLILLMAIASVLGRDITSTKLALIMVWWAGYTRIIRGQVLSIRENTYIDAARAAGTSETRIMFRHILPNSWAPVVVNATLDMGTVVLTLAGLSYLGLGVRYGYAEWGSMIQKGQEYLTYGAWWMLIFPGIAIVTFVLAFNLIGDGLRDVLDPKMRR